MEVLSGFTLYRNAIETSVDSFFCMNDATSGDIATSRRVGVEVKLSRFSKSESGLVLKVGTLADEPSTPTKDGIREAVRRRRNLALPPDRSIIVNTHLNPHPRRGESTGVDNELDAGELFDALGNDCLRGEEESGGVPLGYTTKLAICINTNPNLANEIRPAFVPGLGEMEGSLMIELTLKVVMSMGMTPQSLRRLSMPSTVTIFVEFLFAGSILCGGTSDLLGQ